MTEMEWLVSTTNPAMMLDQLRSKSIRSKPSERKLRLICVACVKRISHLVDEPEQEAFSHAIAVAELFAENGATKNDLQIITSGIPKKWEIAIAFHACKVEAQQAARSVVISAGLFVRHRLKGVQR